MIAKSQRWQKTALAAAAIAFMGLCANSAMALSLGRITVQSALGEPLRAEIDIPEINAEEAATLRAGVAHPDAFVAAGLEYNTALSTLQATVQRRANGQAYIRLTSARPINDPFVDMILEASWSSGRIIRDFTMLFDPPIVRQPAAPTLPQASTPPVQTSRPAPATTQSSAPVDTGRATPASKPVAAPIVPTSKAPSKPASDSGKTVTVRDGDTAGKIAANAKPVGISLDQMLVAMLRSNPDAFLKGNINRIRSGAVINMPSEEQARAVSASEASQQVVAQSKDFNDFRRNLATSVPTAPVVTADRKSSGSVTAKVEDKKATAATPDKLTLSKGSVQAKADEARIAKERAEKDATARAAELAKNIKELSKVAAAAKPVASAPVVAAPAAAAATKPAASSPIASVPVAAVAPPVAVTASAPNPAPAVSAPTPAAAPVAAAKPAVAAPAPAAPVEEPGILDELLADPLVPAGAGGLLVLLGGFAFWRQRQNKKNAAQVDSSFLESRLQPDSFFGASGGQRIDTANEGPVSNSSMVYSASQLDAADDVDPVAEADVYLAYGRDLQAEEILKEAVRTNPNRLAIHTKLLEIYAKRRDGKGFEAAATTAFKLTGGSSPEWARICEMGLSIDPDNKLYQPGITSVSGFGDLGPAPTEATMAFKRSDAPFANSTVPQSVQPEFGESKSMDLDLDLDFSMDDEPASAISDMTGGKVPEPAEQTQKMASAPSSDDGMSLDFDVSGPASLSAEPGPAAALPEISLSMDGLSMSDDDMMARPDFVATDTAPPDTGRTGLAASDSTSAGMLEFDMGSLSLDLDPPSEQPSEAPTLSGDDPLETKLALADEFISIGDEDGARALIEEVVAEATGDMRAKAQRALANLS